LPCHCNTINWVLIHCNHNIMAATAQQVCPIVGTTNTVLPPSHPDVDMNAPGLVCPVTKATTDHHHVLHKHPGISSNTDLGAEACPALKDSINSPKNKAMDEGICEPSPSP
jgi:hypothetical protein